MLEAVIFLKLGRGSHFSTSRHLCLSTVTRVLPADSGTAALLLEGAHGEGLHTLSADGMNT